MALPLWRAFQLSIKHSDHWISWKDDCISVEIEIGIEAEVKPSFAELLDDAYRSELQEFLKLNGDPSNFTDVGNSQLKNLRWPKECDRFEDLNSVGDLRGLEECDQFDDFVSLRDLEWFEEIVLSWTSKRLADSVSCADLNNGEDLVRFEVLEWEEDWAWFSGVGLSLRDHFSQHERILLKVLHIWLVDAHWLQRRSLYAQAHKREDFRQLQHCLRKVHGLKRMADAQLRERAEFRQRLEAPAHLKSFYLDFRPRPDRYQDLMCFHFAVSPDERQEGTTTTFTIKDADIFMLDISAKGWKQFFPASRLSKSFDGLKIVLADLEGLNQGKVATALLPMSTVAALAAIVDETDIVEKGCA